MATTNRRLDLPPRSVRFSRERLTSHRPDGDTTSDAQPEAKFVEFQHMNAAVTSGERVTKMVTVSEAAERCRCSTKSLRRWIHSGRIRARRVGQRWLVDPAALDELLATPGQCEGLPIASATRAAMAC
jgi:excisionase family DNA binding protein